MPTLLLRLSAPMQSWGTTSRFDERDSQMEPSKSGVIGLLCAALGRDRREAVDDLAALHMGVRVDQEGHLLKDYQTATGVMTAAGKVDLKRTVLSPRYYLSDATFLVGLEGADGALLASLHTALSKPVWPLALGRKSFPPALPVQLPLPDCLRDEDLRTALLAYPLLVDAPKDQDALRLRLMLEDPAQGAVRLDQPVAPFSERRFGPRYVRSEMVDVPLKTHS